MNLVYIKYFYLFLPVALCFAYWPAGYVWEEGFVYPLLERITNLLIFILFFWALPGIVVPGLFWNRPAIRKVLQKIFFGIKTSLILVFIAYIIKASFALVASNVAG